MLERIHILDFAVARDVTVEPGPGLNVFTGETGAGKSLIVDALAFAFGARKGREVLAAGADRAVVEVAAQADGGPVLIERVMGRAGRASGRVDGETAAVEQLTALGDRLVDIHGQSEQLGILRPIQQLAVLDAFAGTTGDAAAVAAIVRELRAVRRQAQTLAADARERERITAQLQFEVEEIDSAALEPGEDDRLRAEQQRLGNAGRLIEASEIALTALDGDELGAAESAANDVVARDTSASDVADAAVAFTAAVDDLRRALRRYRDELEIDPERLQFVQQRLDLIARLRRKYGDTIDDILAYGEAARERLATLQRADVSIEELAAKERDLHQRVSPKALALSRARREAARVLAGAVARELGALGMPGARLAAGFATSDDDAGLPLSLPDFEVVDEAWEPHSDDGDAPPRAFTESGVDRVEFLVAFNPGSSLKPLAAVASGGETSRFLLALTTVLGAAEAPKTIVFDEVDEGVGGRAGALVGAALARLAERHQVLCITHLPQVAAYGSRHFVVSKQTDGTRTWSEIREVLGDERTNELASMLGAVTDASREAARELLEAARRA